MYRFRFSGSNSCSIRFHSLKAKGVTETEVCIQPPIVADRRAVYLYPYLLTSAFSPKVHSLLLNTECSVKVWSSFLPSLSSLSPRDITLVVLVDQAAVVFKIPFKNKAASNNSTIHVDNTFASEHFVVPDYSLRFPVSNLDTFVPAICGCIDELYANSKNLRGDIEGLKEILVADLGKVNFQFSLLIDTFYADPSIANVPLRSPWEGIVFLKDVLDKNIQRILPAIQQLQ